MHASRKLSPEVKNVLERSTVTGKRLDLPPGQLDRKLYLRVADALALMGGAWNKRERAHLFEDDAEQVVADAIATGTVLDFRKEFQLFETPPAVARELAQLADLAPRQEVLEPSAGRGRLVEAIRLWEVEPMACELNADNRAALVALNVTLIDDDFLQLRDRFFDRIVANPPFSRQQDILHVSHMFSLLRPGGRLVSVMSPAWTYRQDRKSSLFRSLVEEADGEWTPLPEGSFTASGTSVDTGVLVLDRLTTEKGGE